MVFVEVELIPAQPPTETSFVSSLCLPFLRAAQDEDRGWGFHPGLQSSVKATSGALFALRGLESSNVMQQAGFRFLRGTQLPDGSWPWPFSATRDPGCWATSLASWDLLTDPESRAAVTAGLRGICEDWSRDSSFIGHLFRNINSGDKIAPQNTASWVEPPAFTLLALDRAPKELLLEKLKYLPVAGTLLGHLKANRIRQLGESIVGV